MLIVIFLLANNTVSRKTSRAAASAAEQERQESEVGREQASRPSSAATADNGVALASSADHRSAGSDRRQQRGIHQPEVSRRVPVSQRGRQQRQHVG